MTNSIFSFSASAFSVTLWLTCLFLFFSVPSVLSSLCDLCVKSPLFCAPRSNPIK